MTPPALTTEALDELAKLEAAATPGPWISHVNGIEVVSAVEGDERFVASIDTTAGRARAVSDTDLIATVRNLLPSLIALAQEAMPMSDEEATATLRDAGMSESDVSASLARLQSGIGTLEKVMAERDALRAALSEIDRVTTWGGSWKSGCACIERIPHIGNLASTVLGSHASAEPAEAARRRTALREIAKLNCGYGDPDECADALRGDTSSVDRPCAACVARDALATPVRPSGADLPTPTGRVLSIARGIANNCACDDTENCRACRMREIFTLIHVGEDEEIAGYVESPEIRRKRKAEISALVVRMRERLRGHRDE